MESNGDDKMKIGWINFFNLIIVALLLIPNIVYALKNRNVKNKSQNRVLNIMEQIGRYGSIFFMIFNIGIEEFGFRSKAAFVIWIPCNGVLILLYLIFWMFYFKKQKLSYAVTLAVIPSLIFLLNGFLLNYWALIVCAVIFCIAHIYVVYQNHSVT